MPTDHEALTALNLEINAAENVGNKEFLASVLASELGFFRANGVVDDASRFLQKVAAKKPPGELRRESIEIETWGNRALVRCVVSQDGKNCDNIRLFVRIDASWKLLAWANEQLP